MAATTRSSSKAATKKQGVSSQNAKVTKKVATTSKASSASSAGKKKAATATVGKKQKKEEEVKNKEEEQPAADEEFDSTDNESSSDEEDTYLKGFDDEEQDVEAAEKEGEYDEKSGISKNAATAKQQKEQLDNAKAKVAEVTKSKKTSDASSNDANNSSTKKARGVLYIGRIPHGFYESQMRAYFGQFGDILHLRLSRNKKTGASKHYAFIEFKDADVARVVSETMDNYLLFGHILKVKLVPTEDVRDDLFVGADRKFTVVDWQGINQQKTNEPKTRKAWDEIQERAKERREKAAERVKSLGIDYVYQAATATPKKETAAAASKVTKAKATKPKATKKKTTKKSA
jgi:nucleolar protein 15